MTDLVTKTLALVRMEMCLYVLAYSIVQLKMPASVFLHSLDRLLLHDDVPPLSTRSGRSAV